MAMANWGFTIPVAMACLWAPFERSLRCPGAGCPAAGPSKTICPGTRFIYFGYPHVFWRFILGFHPKKSTNLKAAEEQRGDNHQGLSPRSFSQPARKAAYWPIQDWLTPASDFCWHIGVNSNTLEKKRTHNHTYECEHPITRNEKTPK